MDAKLYSSSVDDYLLIKSVAHLKNEHDLLQHSQIIYDEISKYDHKKILLDNIATRYPSDLFQYYKQVQYYNTNFPPDIRFLKIACMIAAEYIKQGNFWEILTANQGLDCKIFTDRDEAVDWLNHTEK